MFRSRERGLAAMLLTIVLIAAVAITSLSVTFTPAPFARPGPGTGIFRTLAGGDDFATGTLDWVRIDETGALALDPAGGDSGLREGTDTTGAYNGGRYLYGTYLSPVWNTGAAVDSIVASWSADTPDGTWLQVEARALQIDSWTKYYTMGVWAEDRAPRGTAAAPPFRRAWGIELAALIVFPPGHRTP